MARDFDKYELRGPYHWDWYRTDKWGYRQRIDRIVNLLPPTGSVLDAGCGDGLVSFRLFQHGLAVHGLDTSQSGIELAIEKTREAILGGAPLARLGRQIASRFGLTAGAARFNRYRAGELRFACESIFDLEVEGSYDHVVCLEVIEHVPEPVRLLEVLHRAARQTVIVTTPDGTDVEPFDYDEQFWTPDEFSALLDREGYRHEQIDVAPDKIAAVIHK